MNNFGVFAGYRTGVEEWYEVVAPHKDPDTLEDIQLKIEFAGLAISEDVVFEMYYEPGLTLG